MHLVGALLAFARPVLTTLQNDQFFISHKHYFEDGLPNLDEEQEKVPLDGDDQSISSFIRTSPVGSAQSATHAALFPQDVCFPNGLRYTC